MVEWEGYYVELLQEKYFVMKQSLKQHRIKYNTLKLSNKLN